MYVYDGKIVQTDNFTLMIALQRHGVGVLALTLDSPSLLIGEEIALQYRSEPKKLMLVSVETEQYDSERLVYYYVLMRRGAFYSPDKLKGGMEKFLAEQSVSEIDI